MLNIEAPNFWRHVASYLLGGAFVAAPLLVPVLAPLQPILIPLGAAMLGIAGTKAVTGVAPGAAPAPRSGTTPPAGRPPV